MEKKNWKFWLKRMGIAGFFFFLLKGIAWLVFGSVVLKTMCN